jgi:hypothetical protein
MRGEFCRDQDHRVQGVCFLRYKLAHKQARRGPGVDGHGES